MVVSSGADERHAIDNSRNKAGADAAGPGRPDDASGRPTLTFCEPADEQIGSTSS